MKPCIRRIQILLVALSVVASACGSGGEEAATPASTTASTSTTTASTSTTTTASTTTTTSTTSTTTTTAPPAVEVSDTALSLAALVDLGADFVDDTWAANSTADPLSEAQRVTRRYVDEYDALPRTPETAELIDRTVAGIARLADLYDRYAPLLSDPATGPDTIDDFLDELNAISEVLVANDEAALELVVAELAERRTPVADYFVTTTDLSAEGSEILEEIFAVFSVLLTDPVAAVGLLEGPAAAIGELGAELANITPPDVVADYHRRHVSLMQGYGDVVAALVEAVREDVQPRTSDLLQIQRLGEEAPALNAERGRLIASALRGEI